MGILLKAFIAGLVLPSVILPLLLCAALHLGKPEVLTIPFLHFIPLIWGMWNLLYFAVFKHFSSNVNGRLLLTGAVLGLLIAVYGVFKLEIPTLVGFPEGLYYLPLIVGPILYALLWRYILKPLNSFLGLQN